MRKSCIGLWILFVVPYPRTDEKLKEQYEKIIDKYFHLGDPYFADSRKGEEAIDWKLPL